MSQNHELTKIKFRIKALSEKTTEAGCSEAEALAALEKVGELLQQYNLTMDEIDIREQKCITVQYDTNSGKHTVASECMVAIAKFTDCKTWWTRRWDESWKKHVVVNFFGTESDVEMARYLCEIIDQAYKTESEKFKNTDVYKNSSHHKRSVTISFGHGMKDRINGRLYELKREHEAALRRAHEERVKQEETVDTETFTPNEKKAAETLIVLKKQLVESEYEKLGMKLQTQKTYRRIRSSSGYSKGREAGGRVNLSRPIGGGSKPSGYLT